ncbi:MAG: CBS domain-containing protein [Bacteroidia bacterium]
MISRDLITQSIPVLLISSKISRARQLFLEFGISHLPVVRKGKFLGMVASVACVSHPDSSQTIKELENDFIKASVPEDIHFLDVVKISVENHLSAIAVLKDYEYAGTIRTDTLLEHLALQYSFNEPGGIITLVMPVRDFSLSEIAHIVESNNAKILSYYLSQNADASRLTVTLKLNSLFMKNIIATFQRYEYEVSVFHFNELQQDDLKDRFDHLMKYLNI